METIGFFPWFWATVCCLSRPLSPRERWATQRCAVPVGHPELSSTWGTSNTLGLISSCPFTPNLPHSQPQTSPPARLRGLKTLPTRSKVWKSSPSADPSIIEISHSRVRRSHRGLAAEWAGRREKEKRRVPLLHFRSTSSLGMGGSGVPARLLLILACT